MKGADTNVLVRYLVQDDPRQSALANRFIEDECSEDDPCYVGHIVLCELVWVLEGSYGQGRSEIVSILEQLLQVGQLKIMEPDIVWRALTDYKASNADFSDHLVARVNQAQGCETTYTFDKKAAKQKAFGLLA